MGKRLTCLYLDIISIPSHFLSKELCAKYHQKIVCPRCPSFRRKMRDVNKEGHCWWLFQWKKKNYAIPKTFGVLNWFKQYIFLDTNLAKFRHYCKRK